MKLTTTTKQMLATVGAASRVISGKNAMPILDCVKLWTSSDGQWWVTGGDVDKQVTLLAPITAAEGEAQDICIGAGKFVQTLSALPDAPMTMETKDGNVIIKVGKGKYKLPFEKAEDYPLLQGVEGENVTRVTVAGSVFVQNVKAGLAARAEDELRPQLSGVAMVCEGEKCTFGASDGHRLYTYTTAVKKEGADMTIIIPSAVAKCVDTMFKACGEVTVETDGKKLRIWSDGITLLCSMIEGRYPDFRRIIPDVSKSYTIIANSKELISALQRCAVFANDNSQLVAIEPKTGDSIELASEDIDFSRGASEEIGVEENDCPQGLRIGANIGHIVGLLKNVTTKNVVLKVTEPTKPIVLLEDNEESGMLQLQMPMIIQ